MWQWKSVSPGCAAEDPYAGMAHLHFNVGALAGARLAVVIAGPSRLVLPAVAPVLCARHRFKFAAQPLNPVERRCLAALAGTAVFLVR